MRFKYRLPDTLTRVLQKPAVAMVGRQTKFLFVTTALVGCGGLSSSNSADGLNRQNLETHIGFFAADSMQGRRAGSVHELQAAEYLRERFIEYGIAPGAGGFFQDFPVQGGKFPVGVACENSPSQSGSTVLVSQNVIGILAGQGEIVNQWIVVSAHYDHLGCADANGTVQIFNGADDNASGTAALLEIARVLGSTELSSIRGRRSIMFQAFAAEEPGLLGSSFYMSNPTVPLDSIVAVVNLDMIGRLRNNRLTLSGTTVTSGWESIIESHNDDGLLLNYDDTYLFRGDHWSYLTREVPAIHFFTGPHGEYHTPNDDTGLLDYQGVVSVGNLALRTIRALSIQNQLPRFGN